MLIKGSIVETSLISGMIRLHKAFLPILFIFIFLIPTKSQHFDTGDKELNVAVGIGSPWVLYKDYKTALPPITVSYDYGFREDIGPGVISIGGLIAATTYKNSMAGTNGPDEYGYKSTTIILGARSTYHYQIFEKIETYGGMHLGLRMEKWKEYGDFPSVDEEQNLKFHPLISVFGGAKYYFSNNLAAMLEMGFSIAFINVGACIRL
jgi:hypothetical protein